jgi:hypothetical protein
MAIGAANAFGRAFIFAAYIAAICGLLIGASAGYDAASADEATVSMEGGYISSEDLNERSDMQEEMYGKAFPILSEAGVLDHADGGTQMPAWYNQLLVSLINSCLWIAGVVANSTAAFIYTNQWIPKIVVEGVIYASWLPMLGFAASRALQFRRSGR